MWSVHWPTQTFSSALAFIFESREKAFISLHFDSKIPEIQQCKKTQNNLLYPFSVLSPEKSFRFPISKDTFFFSVNCSLESWRCVWKDSVVNVTYFQIPIWLSKDSFLLFLPLPRWTSLSIVMDLVIWHRICHLRNNIWHLQPALPNWELCAQWVLK